MDYNKPIKITDVTILDMVSEPKRKVITFEYNNEYFKYKYGSSGNMGGIHIYKYDNIDTAMNSLARTGKEEIIYNTFNAHQCTEQGNFLEYSIMHWQK